MSTRSRFECVAAIWCRRLPGSRGVFLHGAGRRKSSSWDFWAAGDGLFPVLRYALELEDLFRWEMCKNAFEKLRSF